MTCSEPEAAVQIQCAWCGKVRGEEGRFEHGARETRLEGDRSHGICPTCLHRELGRFAEDAASDR
jgi:hypothetical protein